MVFTLAYGGHPVSYESHLLPADRIADLLDRAGLVVTAHLSQELNAASRREVATFMARKPGFPRA